MANDVQPVYAAEEDGHLVLAGATFTDNDLERFSQDNPTYIFGRHARRPPMSVMI
jgi:hypothetical protein